MRNLDMIETQGGGLRKIFNFQRNRYFPMPEFDFSDGKVKFSVTGKIINQNYARILNKNPNLKFDEVLILDKVQKNKALTDEELYFCKNINFVIERNEKIELFVEDENESNNEFGINGEKFGINDNEFGINGEKFSINDEKFSVNGEKFSINQEKFSVNQEKILSLIDKNPIITVNEIAEKLGKTERAVYKNLAKLKEMNIIDRVGSRKTGEWKILKY
jgi:predicted HTH transcriptional regulator